LRIKEQETRLTLQEHDDDDDDDAAASDIYVRATCFDIVGLPQALEEHRSKRCAEKLNNA